MSAVFDGAGVSGVPERLHFNQSKLHEVSLILQQYQPHLHPPCCHHPKSHSNNRRYQNQIRPTLWTLCQRSPLVFCPQVLRIKQSQSQIYLQARYQEGKFSCYRIWTGEPYKISSRRQCHQPGLNSLMELLTPLGHQKWPSYCQQFDQECPHRQTEGLYSILIQARRWHFYFRLHGPQILSNSGYR